MTNAGRFRLDGKFNVRPVEVIITSAALIGGGGLLVLNVGHYGTLCFGKQVYEITN